MEMRKLSLIFFLLLSTSVNAAAPSRTYNYVSHTTIDPSQVNTNENSLYNYLQAGVDTYAGGSITNAAVSSSAAISYSKLNLLGSITNADISPTAAIVGSKLDLTIPGPIGSATPSTGAFTTLSANGNFNASGTVNIGVTHQGDVFYDNGTSIARLPPGTTGQYLKTLGNSANPLWADTTFFSNVLFQYSGQVEAQGAGLGEVVGTTIAPTVASGNYRFLQSNASGAGIYKTIWTNKFIKIAGISTVTVWTRIWVATGGGIGTANLKLDIGGANGNVTGTGNQVTPEWKSFTIDVSGLSNGTSYDVTASLTDSSGNSHISFCSNIIGFGS